MSDPKEAMAISPAAQGKPRVRRRPAPVPRRRKARGKGYERRAEILAAARALVKHSGLDAGAIVEQAMAIAADICIYTNGQLVVEEI